MRKWWNKYNFNVCMCHCAYHFVAFGYDKENYFKNRIYVVLKMLMFHLMHFGSIHMEH